MSNKTNIAIVGSGLSGATIATQQILKLIEQKTLSDWVSSNENQVKISIYDKSGIFGSGEPYKTNIEDKGLFLLNQPAYAMSPFKEQPNHFIKWLSKKGYPFKGNDFVPRDIYGSYLKDFFKKAMKTFEKFGCGSVELISDEVKDIIRSSHNNYSLVTKKGNNIDANIVVLSPGHGRSKLLSKFKSHSCYFDAPYSTLNIDNLKEAKEPAFILGSSQSMLDALAVLDSIGFKRKIYAVSRNLCKPWRYDPEHEKNVGEPYRYKLLTPETLGVASSYLYEDLKHFFDREVEIGLDQGFPLGHILSQFNAKQLSAEIQNKTTFQNFMRLASYANALYGNPTSPERYNMMKHYEEKGQLKFVSADVNELNIKPLKNGFEIEGSNINSKFSALFNSASYSMKSITDEGYISMPLLNKLSKRNALKRNSFDKNAFAFGKQKWSGLFLAGPSCNSQRWGAETFRDSLSEIALDSVAQFRQHQNLLVQ